MERVAAAVLLLEEMLEGVLEPLAVTGRPLPVAPHRDEAARQAASATSSRTLGVMVISSISK